jgi:hypothetical protein
MPGLPTCTAIHALVSQRSPRGDPKVDRSRERRAGRALLKREYHDAEVAPRGPGRRCSQHAHRHLAQSPAFGAPRDREPSYTFAVKDLLAYTVRDNE